MTGPANRIAWVSDVIRLEIVLWERIDSRLKERHELPLSYFESLHFVSRAPGRSLRIGDLAQALGITIGGTSKLVDRIVNAGLLQRRPDPGDRRAAHVTLTPAGRRTLIAATKTYDAEVAALADPILSPHEQQRLHDYVTRLLAGATTSRDPS